MCQFIGYSLYDKELKVLYFRYILDISSSPKIKKTRYNEYKHVLDKNMKDFLDLITRATEKLPSSRRYLFVDF